MAQTVKTAAQAHHQPPSPPPARFWRGALQGLSWLLSWYSVVLALAGWEFLANAGWFNPRLFPTLGQIWQRLLILWESGDLLYHTNFTLGRAMLGLGLAVLVGIPVGLLMGRVRGVERLLDPFMALGYPVPKIALYPIFIYLLGVDSAPKIALVFLECAYPMIINTYYGSKTVNQSFLWAARNMGASRFDIYRKVIIPAISPNIFTGLRIAMPVALIIVIITEMVGSSTGLGYLIIYSSSSFRTSAVFAGVVVVAILGFLLDRLIILVRNLVLAWDTKK